MATLLLGAVGAIIGSATGGPAGARMGWSIGTTLGGIVEGLNQPGINTTIGELTDLKISGSNYGVSIPVVWGEMAVPGNIIWALRDSAGNHLFRHEETTTQGGGGSGGGPKSTTTRVWYTSTYYSMLCSTSFLDIENNLIERPVDILKIFANDQMIYEDGSSNNLVDIELQDGSEGQGPDSAMYSDLGGDCPYNRGTGGFSIENHDLSPYNGMLPNLYAVVKTQSPCTVGDIFTDLCLMAGIPADMIDGSAGVETVKGFVMTDRTSPEALLQVLATAYMYNIIEVDGMIKLSARSETPYDIPFEDLNCYESSSDRYKHYIRSLVDDIDLPGQVDVTYYSAEKNYEQVTQSDTRSAVESSKPISLVFPMVMDDEQAKKIAAVQNDIAWLESENVSIRVPTKYVFLAPGDEVNVELEEGIVSRFRIKKMILGDPGIIELDLTPAEPSLLERSEQGATTTPGNEVPEYGGPTDFYAWSGKELKDQDIGTVGFYVAANGGVNWRGAGIYYSPDSGGTWINAGTVLARSWMGETTDNVDLLPDETEALSWDHVVDVNIYRTTDQSTISTVNTEQILNGENIFLMGQEIVGIQTWSPTDPPDGFDTSDFYRGLRGSDMTGHVGFEKVVHLTPNVVRINIPKDYVGTTIKVKCVSPGEVLDDVTAQDVVIADPTASDVDNLSNFVQYPVFLASVESLVSNQTTTQTWTGIDINPYVPNEATKAILQVHGKLSGPDDGSVSYLNLRRQSGAIEIIGGACQAGGDGDVVSFNAQIMVDITSSYSFQYEIEIGFNGGVSIDLIGYWRKV